MTSKTTTKLQLSSTESKNQQRQKQTKQLKQEQNHRYGHHMEGYQWWGRGDNGGKCTGNKKHNWQVQNRQGDVKNSIGNGEAK